jgi:subtilase family serine protease
VCGRPTQETASCRSIVLSSDGVVPLASTTPAPGSLGPGLLASAYKYSLPIGVSTWTWNHRTVAIVDAMDNPHAAADLTAYRSHYHLPPCTVASGCFRKLNENGAATPLPAGDLNWGMEIDLDLQMVSAVCPQCRIRLIEASSASLFDLVTAEDRAATIGASAISNSWGSTGELGSIGPLLFDSFVDHPGIAITAATGDNGYGGSWPSDVPTVIAVGGTSLTRAANARGWDESVWSGAGSWCSDVDSQPAWQAAAVQQTATATNSATCTQRTSADVAATADPLHGVAAYDSYGSTGGANWFVFGGTSVATPIIASMYARRGDHIHDAANPYPARATYNAWYTNHNVLNDPTSGSNGACGTDPVYMCNGEPGYDAPTGIGTPNGLSAF